MISYKKRQAFFVLMKGVSKLSADKNILMRNLTYLKFREGIKSNAELSRLISQPTTTLQSYISNPTPHSRVRYALATYFGVSPEDLETKDLSLEDDTNAYKYNDYSYNSFSTEDLENDDFQNMNVSDNDLYDSLVNEPLNKHVDWRPADKYTFTADTVKHIIHNFDVKRIEGFTYKSDLIHYYLICEFNDNNKVEYYFFKQGGNYPPVPIPTKKQIMHDVFQYFHKKYLDEAAQIFYDSFKR